MTHYRHRLVRLNRQVEVAEDCSPARRVSEPQVLKLDSTMGNILDALLFRINLRRLLDDSKDQLGRLACSWDRWELRKGDTRSNRTNEDNVAASENIIWVQIVLLSEQGAHIEDDSNEDKANALRVSEEESRDMSLLDSSLSWHNKQLIVALKNHLHIFWTKCYHCLIVEDDVR